MTLDKKNVFTLQNANGYTVFTAYCATVGYDPYLHDEKPDYIPDKFDVSVSLRSFTAKRHHLHINISLHRKNPHSKREGVKTQRDPHMV